MIGDPIPWYQRPDYWNPHKQTDPMDDWDQSWSSNITIKNNTKIDSNLIEYKFNEDITLQEVTDYINSTYAAHYSEKGGVQTLDYIMANSESLDFLKGNAIKYLARYGKKEGRNKKDLFKAIHYIILLHYFSENNPNE